MGKNYSKEFKLECIRKYKNNEFIELPPGYTAQRKEFMNTIRLWVRMYDLYGEKLLEKKNYAKHRPLEERLALVQRVFAGENHADVAISDGIHPGLLYRRVKAYKEKGVDGLKYRKGGPRAQPSTMKKRDKKTRLSPEEKEELKLLRERNEYLEAENAYLKKLRALLEKEVAPHKAKKQKQ